MKTLETKEWIAVIIGLFVVGFFFIFGHGLLSIFNNDTERSMAPQTEVSINEELIGTGEIAQPGDSIAVHYTGKFQDGTVFDSSVGRGEPFQFILGVGQVIEGWDRGVVGMRVGGKRTLIIPPQYGYGMNDYGPIPGGSTLIFEIELLRVEKP